MGMFPLFVNLDGCTCLVVGAGRVAARRSLALLQAGARVVVVSPAANEDMRHILGDPAWSGNVHWEDRVFSSGDLQGARLVIAATDNREVNAAVVQAAKQVGAMVNVADDPAACDFYFPAIARRAEIVVGITTSGQDPGRARALRKRVEQMLEEEGTKE